MKQGPALALLLATSIAAGAWWFRPVSDVALRPPGEEGRCAEASTCTTVPAADPAARPAAEPPSSPAAAGRSGEAPAPSAGNPTQQEAAPDSVPEAPPPLTREDGIRLREEADRLLADGQVPEGLATLRQAAEANPTPENWAYLGDLLGRLTAFHESARSLRRAAELDPDNADRWIALANAWYRVPNPGEAWKAEKRARQAEPGLVLGRDSDGMRIRAGDSGGGAQ